MSTPHEASLTEKERAILAGLAAQAEADDPSLAATLRGRARRARGWPRPAFRLRVPAAVSHWGWGVVVAVVGLILVVASLSFSIVLGIVGALLMSAGIYRAASVRLGRSPQGDSHKPTPATSDN
jgi:hypothetical protein